MILSEGEIARDVGKWIKSWSTLAGGKARKLTHVVISGVPTDHDVDMLDFAKDVALLVGDNELKSDAAPYAVNLQLANVGPAHVFSGQVSASLQHKIIHDSSVTVRFTSPENFVGELIKAAKKHGLGIHVYGVPPAKNYDGTPRTDSSQTILATLRKILRARGGLNVAYATDRNMQLTNPVWAIKLAYKGDRSPEVQAAVAKSGETALRYAEITGERFELGEPALVAAPDYAAIYASTILKRRWPEIEPQLLNLTRAHPWTPINYALRLGFQWPELEAKVKTEPAAERSPSWRRYQEEVIDKRDLAKDLEARLNQEESVRTLSGSSSR